MAEYVLKREQYLPLPVEEVFDFFSRAENLDFLTPPWLHFRILTPLPIAMQQGTIIDYRIRWRWLPLRWRTEIVDWDPPHRFVDLQLRGPYKLWHHTHTFVPQGDGTLMTDCVRYQLGWGPLGRWMHRWYVAKDLEAIFDYRRQRIADHFSAPVVSASAARMLEDF